MSDTKYNNNVSRLIAGNLIHKQKGAATLLISIFLLFVLTIVGVSAVKITSLDTLIAGNDQQKMILFQETETRLKQLASIQRLSQTFTATGFTNNVTDDPQQYVFDETAKWPGFKESIYDMQANYPCEQGGSAMSLGPNMPVCDLYSFQVNARKKNMGVKDKHHRGAGKMVPSKSGNGSLMK